MHPQLYLLIAQEHIADMHRDAAERVWRVKPPAPPGARSDGPLTSLIEIASERMTAPSAHAALRAEMCQPEGP